MLNKITDSHVLVMMLVHTVQSCIIVGRTENFSCCCEHLCCVVPILHLCCQIFFSHLWSGIARTCCFTEPSLVLEAICCYSSSGYFMCFLFLQLDCISLQAPALTEARERTHRRKRNNSKQNNMAVSARTTVRSAS